MDAESETLPTHESHQRFQPFSSHVQLDCIFNGLSIDEVLHRNVDLLVLYSVQACYYPQRQDNVRLFCIPEARKDFTYVGSKILHGSYFFYLLKVADLLDTIFFILRKKNNQVTFLHTYHHAGMAFAGYLYLKIYSGGGYALVLGKLFS